MKNAQRLLSRCGATLLVVLLGTGGCELNLTNPNAPTEEAVFTSIEGIIAAAVGMQSEYGSDIEDFLLPSSLGTDEWGTGSRSLVSYRSLLDGENFDPSYAVVEAPWAAAYRTVKAANALLGNAPSFEIGPAFDAGLIAVAKLYKSMALGSLIMIYEEVPIDVSVEGPVPQPRAAVLDTVLALLESARTDIAGFSDADLAGFRSRALGAGFDLRNTIDAMLARYYLIDGQYGEAITAADRVDVAVSSVFSYPDPNRNPVENLSFQLEYVFALESWVNEAEAGDGRVAYWVDNTAAAFPGNPDSLLLPLNKYTSPNDPFPVYLPDEMRLIKAEALTRQGQLAEARTLVNDVRTQSSSAVDEPLADLPALPDAALDSEAELLAQIAYERRYELYMQGLRWEDVRRFGEALTTTPVFQYLPIPQQECDANPSNPC
jgi:hypothetical protein